MTGMVLSMSHRVRNSIRFNNSESENLWIVFAKSTPWLDDENPPEADINTTTIEDIIIAKRASIKWVVQDSLGTYTFIAPPIYEGGPNTVTTWIDLTTELEAVQRDCRWCLLQSEVTGVELSEEFRIVAFVSGIVPIVGKENSSLLSGSEIDSFGHIETITYRKPSTLSRTGIYTMSNIIEF